MLERGEEPVCMQVGHSIDDEVVEEDGSSVTRKAPPSMAVLEESLNEVESQYACKESRGSSWPIEVTNWLAWLCL